MWSVMGVNGTILAQPASTMPANECPENLQMPVEQQNIRKETQVRAQVLATVAKTGPKLPLWHPFCICSKCFNFWPRLWPTELQKKREQFIPESSLRRQQNKYNIANPYGTIKFYIEFYTKSLVSTLVEGLLSGRCRVNLHTCTAKLRAQRSF